MKFNIEKVNGETAGLCIVNESTGTAIINGNAEMLESVLRSYSMICGEKTKQRLRNAIDRHDGNGYMNDRDFTGRGINYSDTPIRGRHYVYLWFDSDGDLFYIGKGIGARASDLRSRTDVFREKAHDGHCECVAYNLDEIYALDLERILIWESVFSGKRLLNIDGGNGVDAIQYCKHDREALLWYWNHEGTIDRFSELTGIQVIYDARNTNIDEATDSRWFWWDASGAKLKTNNPVILEEMRKTEEKKQKQREYYANRRLKQKQDNSCRA